MIGDGSWYKITIESSSLSLLQSYIHKINHFIQKVKNVAKLKDDSSDRNCAKPRLFGRLLGHYLTMIHWDHGDYEKYQVQHRHHHRHLKSFNNNNRTDVITGYYQVPYP